MSSAIALYVVSEKGAKELVAQVRSRPALEAPALVVEGYTRDTAILKHIGGANGGNGDGNGKGKLSLYAEGEDKNKLAGFAKYLKQRGKAGVAKQDRNTLYLLPPSGEGEAMITCLVTTKHREQPSSISSLSSSAARPAANYGSTPAAPPAAPPSAAPKKQAPKPVGLLGALASKMNNTEAARTALMNKKDREVRDKTVSYITRMETELKAKLQEFADDDKQRVLRLEPMDKDYRYVVHDMVGLFESLLSASCGDMDERHVVIYKKGDEVPEGVEIHVSKDDMVAATLGHAAERSRASRKIEEAQYKVNLSQLQAMSTKVNVNKRDRRSIEELEHEAKEAKKSKTTEGTTGGEEKEEGGE